MGADFELLLVRRWTDVTQRGVASAAIVKHFDIFKQTLPGGLSSRVALVMHQLCLERPKEAFGHRIVVTVAAAAHARLQAVSGEQALIVVASVLHAAIAVMQHG